VYTCRSINIMHGANVSAAAKVPYQQHGLFKVFEYAEPGIPRSCRIGYARDIGYFVSLSSQISNDLESYV